MPSAAAPLLFSMEEYFKQLTLWLASGSEAAAAVVIGLATIEATISALWLFALGTRPQTKTRAYQDAKEEVRLRLGRWLAVALELELAADVLRTAVARTLERDRAARRDRGAANRAELCPAEGDRKNRGARLADPVPEN